MAIMVRHGIAGGRRAGIALIAGASLIAQSSAAFAHDKPIAILAKPGTTWAGRAADQATCHKVVEKSPGADMPEISRTGGAMGAAPNLAAVAGAAIVFGIFALIDSGRAQAAGETFCMTNLGYAPVPLTPEETTQYKALPPEKQTAWEQAFLAQDLTARIAAVALPKVPPLPAYRDEPDTLGGLRFLMAGMTAPTGSVSIGDTVLNGQVERWRTARLAADFDSANASAQDEGPTYVTIAGRAGTVFHQVDYRSQRDPLLRDAGATWCGPVMQSVGGVNPAPSVYCFGSHRDGYSAYHPTGFGWLAGPQGEGYVLPDIVKPILLEERAQDDLGALDFSIAIASISGSAVTLDGVVTHGGQKVHVWTRRLKPDRDHRIVVPMWQHRLILTPLPAAKPASEATTPPPARYSVAIDAHGDGKSLRDAW